MAVKNFNLPDPGEGLTEAEVTTWKVKVGDQVAVNDIVIEVETAKSLVELPIPFAGTVVELLAAEGDTVDVGAPIIAVEVGGADSGGDRPRVRRGGGGCWPEPRRLRRQSRQHATSRPHVPSSRLGRGRPRPSGIGGTGAGCGRNTSGPCPSRRSTAACPGQAAGAQARQGPRRRPAGGRAVG
ncbi:hypothetical protein ON003_07345 [Janibacter hoylei]|nr:biotin/lipoyl-containing protein [Janibacter hoylei]MCW4601423.1 hypothetical protein [Janibacter hoylei]